MLSKRINKENEISKKSLIQKFSLNLVKVVLILGLIAPLKITKFILAQILMGHLISLKHLE
jgi:hypothetical protein